MVHFGKFLKIEACGQTELPDMSIFIDQKLLKIPKLKKIKGDIWITFHAVIPIHRVLHTDTDTYFLHHRVKITSFTSFVISQRQIPDKTDTPRNSTSSGSSVSIIL